MPIQSHNCLTLSLWHGYSQQKREQAFQNKTELLLQAWHSNVFKRQRLNWPSQPIKQSFSCEILNICIQSVVILFEVDVGLEQKGKSYY